MIEKIGIVGAGQMGNGIAHVCALAGYEVCLRDVEQERLDAAIESIDRNLTRQVMRGTIDEAGKQTALARIHPSLALDRFADVDLVIEAASEDEQVKRQIFVELCPLLKSETILTSNTSSLSITRLAASTDRPEQFMGMHFMNPVPMMKLVELIRGIATGESTFAEIRELTIKLGKIPSALG